VVWVHGGGSKPSNVAKRSDNAKTHSDSSTGADTQSWRQGGREGLGLGVGAGESGGVRQGSGGVRGCVYRMRGEWGMRVDLHGVRERRRFAAIILVCRKLYFGRRQFDIVPVV
jgi:hypothetical protein